MAIPIDPVELPSRFTRRAAGGPTRLTEIVTLADGREERNQVWANSRRRWSLTGVLRDANDLDEVVEFFQAREGPARGFLWKDHTDFKSSRLADAIAATDQALGVGDGSRVAFPLVKRYGGPAYAHLRRIRRPVAGTVTVKVGASVLAPDAFAVDLTTGVVTLDVAPGAAVAVTAGFEYRVPVRFERDMVEVDLEQIAEGAGFGVGILEIIG